MAAYCIDACMGFCEGAIKYRTPLTATGISYARCEHHWDLRLDLVNQLHPVR